MTPIIFRSSTAVALSLLSILLLTQCTTAFWILAHGTLTIDRLDPIVSPGNVSSHVHTVVGASAFGPIVSTQSLQASNCTTSPVQDDKSSYWAPQLYHQNTENKTLTLVPILFVNTYYEQRPESGNTTVSAFPPGLRILAGDMHRTSYNDSDTSNKAVNFVCLDYSGTSSQSTAFPTTNCKDGLRAQITFPSCWDGKNLDSDDHQSHMSYPLGGNPDNGDCPESHPQKLITLFTEWIFDVNRFEFKEGQKNWVFSFGDDVGYGFHSDFVNGWKQEVLEAAIQQCTGDLFDNVEGCPPFTSSIKRDVASSCHINSVVEEDVGNVSPISKLPGCNPIPMNKNATCSNTTTPSIMGNSTSSGNDTTSGVTSDAGDSTATGSSTGGSSTAAGFSTDDSFSTAETSGGSGSSTAAGSSTDGSLSTAETPGESGSSTIPATTSAPASSSSSSSTGGGRPSQGVYFTIF